jgi:hypothetical protein
MTGLTAATRRQVLRHGQAVTLRRLSGTGGSQTATDVACTAVVAWLGSADLVAGSGLMQGDRRVTITDHEIAAAAWPGPPRKNDRVVIAGAVTAIVAPVETRRHAGQVDRHVMIVRGA